MANRTKGFIRKALSLLVVLAMVLPMAATPAFAAEIFDESYGGASGETSGETSGESETGDGTGQSGPEIFDGDGEVPGETYAVRVEHLLAVEGGAFRSTTVVVIPAGEAADYDFAQEAIVKEGLELVSVTPPDFSGQGEYVAQLNYRVAGGYRVVLNNGGQAQMAEYLGDLGTAQIVPDNQVSVTVEILINGTLVASDTAVVTVAEGGDTYTYKIPNEYQKYTYRSVAGGDYDQSEYTVTVSGLNPETRFYTVTVEFSAPIAAYTVEHIDGATGVVIDTTEGHEGYVGSMTQAAPKDIEHYSFDRVEDVEITEDGTAVAKVYYTPDTYHVIYDSQGGSYVPPVEGGYGDPVTVYTTEPGKTCAIPEHTHITA